MEEKFNCRKHGNTEIKVRKKKISLSLSLYICTLIGLQLSRDPINTQSYYIQLGKNIAVTRCGTSRIGNILI